MLAIVSFRANVKHSMSYSLTDQCSVKSASAFEKQLEKTLSCHLTETRKESPYIIKIR